jgi:nicotinamidase/pyrazinamidase
MKRALILVDLQHDFLPTGALPVPHGDQVISVANQLLNRKDESFDLVVATQDWHPADHESFASKHPGSNVGSLIDLHGVSQVLWPDHCVQNTYGAQFASGLLIGRMDHVVRKGQRKDVDSYSGFFDNARRGDTGLQSLLKNHGITHLTVMGLATDYCVKFTVLDARSLGFDVDVVRDGCRAVNMQVHDDDRAFDAMKAVGARILNLSDLFNQ